jgi:hypothetical protein
VRKPLFEVAEVTWKLSRLEVVGAVSRIRNLLKE